MSHGAEQVDIDWETAIEYLDASRPGPWRLAGGGGGTWEVVAADDAILATWAPAYYSGDQATMEALPATQVLCHVTDDLRWAIDCRAQLVQRGRRLTPAEHARCTAMQSRWQQAGHGGWEYSHTLATVVSGPIDIHSNTSDRKIGTWTPRDATVPQFGRNSIHDPHVQALISAHTDIPHILRDIYAAAQVPSGTLSARAALFGARRAHT